MTQTPLSNQLQEELSASNDPLVKTNNSIDQSLIVTNKISDWEKVRSYLKS